MHSYIPRLLLVLFCPEMNVMRHTFCSTPRSVQLSLLSVNLFFGVSISLSFFFWDAFLITVFVYLRGRIRSTLCDLFRPYFSPNVLVKLTRKARGHFVALN